MKARVLNPNQDFHALAHLLNKAAKVDSIAMTNEIEQKELATMFETYGHSKQWLIDHPELSNEVIAYTWFYKQTGTPYAEFTLTIHPDFREAQLETTLLDVIIQEAKSQNASYLYALIDSKNLYLHNILLHQGFKLERGYHAMEMPLTHPFPEAQFPKGFNLRTFDQVMDMKVIVDIVNKGWSDLPGHKVGIDDNVGWVNQQPHDSIFLLFDPSENIAGITGTLFLEDGLARIDAGGLVPQYRSPDLYRQLALVALNYASKMGCTKAKLESWGDFESTLDVYKQLGFEIIIREIGYRLDLK